MSGATSNSLNNRKQWQIAALGLDVFVKYVLCLCSFLVTNCFEITEMEEFESTNTKLAIIKDPFANLRSRTRLLLKHAIQAQTCSSHEYHKNYSSRSGNIFVIIIRMCPFLWQNSQIGIFASVSCFLKQCEWTCSRRQQIAHLSDRCALLEDEAVLGLPSPKETRSRGNGLVAFNVISFWVRFRIFGVKFHFLNLCSAALISKCFCYGPCQRHSLKRHPRS